VKLFEEISIFLDVSCGILRVLINAIAPPLSAVLL
jgi:hypothetical protein